MDLSQWLDRASKRAGTNNRNIMGMLVNEAQRQAYDREDTQFALCDRFRSPKSMLIGAINWTQADKSPVPDESSAHGWGLVYHEWSEDKQLFAFPMTIKEVDLLLMFDDLSEPDLFYIKCLLSERILFDYCYADIITESPGSIAGAYDEVIALCDFMRYFAGGRKRPPVAAPDKPDPAAMWLHVIEEWIKESNNKPIKVWFRPIGDWLEIVRILSQVVVAQRDSKKVGMIADGAKNKPEQEPEPATRSFDKPVISKYQLDVEDYSLIDVYDICNLADIDDPSGATQHAIKKLLFAGQRGYKDRVQDLTEAMLSIERAIKFAQLSR